jgi:hypothetical protein
VSDDMMASYKLPYCPLRQSAPFALLNKFGASPARRPRTHRCSAGEDRRFLRAKVGASVQLKYRRSATEIAMVTAARHDAGPSFIEPFQICHAARQNFARFRFATQN